MYLTSPLRVFTKNFVTAVELKKTINALTRRRKELDDMCLRLDTILERDGRRDGQICHNNIALCMH